MSTCNCEKPPGGSGKCPSDHLAFCRSDGHSCDVSCVKPNSSLASMIFNESIQDNVAAARTAILDTAGYRDQSSFGELTLSVNEAKMLVGTVKHVNGDVVNITFPPPSSQKKKSTRKPPK